MKTNKSRPHETKCEVMFKFEECSINLGHNILPVNLNIESPSICQLNNIKMCLWTFKWGFANGWIVPRSYVLLFFLTNTIVSINCCYLHNMLDHFLTIYKIYRMFI